MWKLNLSVIQVISKIELDVFIDPLPHLEPFNVSAHKGKQMLPGGSKCKTALQAGYFDKTFNRIMTGEAHSDPVKLRRQDRLEQSKRNLGKAFMPSHAGKNP